LEGKSAKEKVMADQPSPRSPEQPASPSTRQLLEELDDLMQRMLALPVQQGDEEQPPAPAQVPAAPAAAPRGVHLLQVPAARVTIQAPLTGQPAQDVAANSAPGESPGAKHLRPTPAGRMPPAGRDETSDPEPAPTYLPLGAEPLLPILLQHPSKAPENVGAPISTSAGPPATAPRPQPLPPARPSWMKTPGTAPSPSLLSPLREPLSPPGRGAGVRGERREGGRAMQWLLAMNYTFDRGSRLLGAPGRWLRGEQGRSIVGWSGIAMIVVALIWAAILFLG